MTEIKDAPSPGSDKAVAKGCLCPVPENQGGIGAAEEGVKFWVSIACPLHDKGVY